MNEPIPDEERCTALHPWTQFRCRKRTGHTGNHDPDVSALTDAETARQRERALALVRGATEACKGEHLVPEIVGGIMFAEYMHVMHDAGFDFDEIVHAIRCNVLIAMSEVKAAQQQRGQG